MRYKKLGNTDIDISVLTVGTWAIGGSGWGDVNDSDSINAIRAMIDNGVNVVDTAPSYGLGHSEEVVGKALSGIRDKVLLLSKCGVHRKNATGYSGDNAPIRDSSKERILKQIDESLLRLKTDYIDIYLVHWPDVKTPFSETVEALNLLKRQGKIRYCGVSNFENDQLAEMYELGGLDFIQYPFSMVNRSKEEIFKKYSQKGVATMGYGSLGAGILTGAIRELPNFDANDARLGFYNFFVEPNFSKVMKLLKTLDKIADNRKVPVAQVAINWTTQNSIITTSLTGVRNVEEANVNCAAMNWSLSEEEMNELTSAIEANIDF